MDLYFEILPKAILQINTRYFLTASIAFLLFYVVLKRPMRERKIQADFPKGADYRREVFFSLLSMSIFAVVATAVFTILRPYTQLYTDIAANGGWGYYFLSLFLMLLVHDTYFYWTHRAMHHPTLYRYIHLVHHKSTNPSPWAAYSFHPLEALLEIGILVLIVMIIPAKPSAVILFFLFQILYNVYGHLGFELMPRNAHKHPILKWINTSVSHNQHHHYFDGNYGLYFNFWDRAMGTFRADYEADFEKATESSKLPPSNTAQRTNH